MKADLIFEEGLQKPSLHEPQSGLVQVFLELKLQTKIPVRGGRGSLFLPFLLSGEFLIKHNIFVSEQIFCTK
jgi:hypothetical protein